MKQPLDRLREIVAQLRGPGGCPWDQEQTHASLKPQLIEESYEVVDAIDTQDPKQLREELGDLLLQVVFHSQLAEEAQTFSLDDVAHDIGEKLIRRHPHVFGQETVKNTEEVLKNWHKIKQQEKPERKTPFDGIPRHLPALMKALEVQKKAAHAGFDWPDASGPLEKVKEECREVEEAGAALGNVNHEKKGQLAEELGDLLFAVVNVARHWKLDAEDCLRYAITKFTARYMAVEKKVTAQGKKVSSCSLEELNEIWDEVKVLLAERPSLRSTLVE